MSKYADAQNGFAEGTKAETRPDGCEAKHLKYLESLRQSGITNMFGARPYLMNAYPSLGGERAAAILAYWMKGGK